MKQHSFFLVLVCLILMSYSVHSQDNDWRLFPGPVAAGERSGMKEAEQSEGELNYIMEEELVDYIGMIDSMDQKESAPKGFRIQIYSASGANSRTSAYESQSEFLSLYPSMDSYTLWSYPNWVVRVGNFRTRLEALEYHMELREEYPASFIIGDRISVSEN